MKELVFVVILFILAIVHFTILYNHYVRNHTVGVFSMVFFILLIYYEIVPIIIYLANPGNLHGYQIRIRESTFEQYFLAEFCVILFSFLFYISYHRYNNYQKKLIYEVDEKKLDSWLLGLGITCFFIGGLAFMIYVEAFGGIAAWYSKSNIVRSFAYSANRYISHFASIMVIPAKLLLASPILLHPVIKKRRGIILKILFGVSWGLSLVFLFGNAGKTDIILFALCFAIPIFKRFMHHPWKFTMIVALVGIPAINYLDALFDFITYGIWQLEDVNFLYTLRQFSYPYCDILYMKDIVKEFGLRWGQDFITGVLNVVPGLNFDASYIPVSMFFGGDTWKVTGGTPIEIISFGYQEFGILGVAFIAVLFGTVCGKLDRTVENISKNSVYAVLSTAITINIFLYVLNADIYALVSSQFIFVIPAFCALRACKLKNQNI